MFSLSASFPIFLKMRKFLLDMREDFLIMSNFHLVEILSEPNSLTVMTSKKILKMGVCVCVCGKGGGRGGGVAVLARKLCEIVVITISLSLSLGYSKNPCRSIKKMPK